MLDNHETKQLEMNLFNMDKRLIELEDKMTSIDSKLSQVVDAILGNALTKTGGFIEEISSLKTRIKFLEEANRRQEDFKKKILWTIGIIISVGLLLEYIANLYVKFKT